MDREVGKIFVETDGVVESWGSGGAVVLGSRGWFWTSSREVWWVSCGGEVNALVGVTSLPYSAACVNTRGVPIFSGSGEGVSIWCISWGGRGLSVSSLGCLCGVLC